MLLWENFYVQDHRSVFRPHPKITYNHQGFDETGIDFLLMSKKNHVVGVLPDT